MDTGIQSVKIDQIDLSVSLVADTGDFHKVPVNEMRAGLRRPKDEVAPAVARGADGDYFSRLDAARGLDYAHGYRRIYDAFYGKNCIRLNQVGDRYQCRQRIPSFARGPSDGNQNPARPGYCVLEVNDRTF